MIGILVEKPSAKKNFAKALGGVQGTFDNEKFVICNSFEGKPEEINCECHFCDKNYLFTKDEALALFE